MYKALRSFSSIRPEELDQYLSHGWFRKDQRMYTTQFIQDRDLRFRDAIWLRHRLSSFRFPDWFQKFKTEGPYTIFMDEAHPSATHEGLYQQYREKKPGLPESLEEILYAEHDENVFESRMINIWDGEELVAAGFFDLGNNSAASIVNFYDPSYACKDLGKLLFYLSAEYALQQGKEYFYTGYFTPGNRHLEHKLDWDRESLEYFHSIYEAWYPYRMFREDHLSLPLMERKLTDLYHMLEDLDMQVYFVFNAGFNENLSSKWDCPFWIYIAPMDQQGSHYMVTYDVNKRRYCVFNCTDAQMPDHLRVVDDKLICQVQLMLSKPLAQEYHFDATIRLLQELVEC